MRGSRLTVLARRPVARRIHCLGSVASFMPDLCGGLTAKLRRGKPQSLATNGWVAHDADRPAEGPAFYPSVGFRSRREANVSTRAPRRMHDRGISAVLALSRRGRPAGRA